MNLSTRWLIKGLRAALLDALISTTQLNLVTHMAFSLAFGTGTLLLSLLSVLFWITIFLLSANQIQGYSITWVFSSDFAGFARQINLLLYLFCLTNGNPLTPRHKT